MSLGIAVMVKLLENDVVDAVRLTQCQTCCEGGGGGGGGPNLGEFRLREVSQWSCQISTVCHLS